MNPIPNPGEWIEILSVTRALIKSLYILFDCFVDTLYIPYYMVYMIYRLYHIDYIRGDSMILVKIFLAWIFLKSVPTCSRRSTQYQINRTDFVLGYEMGGKGQKRRISYFWIDFWKLLNQSFSIFYMWNLSILKKNGFLYNSRGSPNFWSCIIKPWTILY